MRVDRFCRFYGIAIVLKVIVAMFALPGCGGGGALTSPGAEPELPGVDPEPPAVERRITTSFGATRLDHDRLDAQLGKPEEPPPSAWDLNDPEELLDYRAAVEHYAELLEEYEAGRCCWRMAPKESPVASRDDVLAMLRENAFVVAVDPPFFEGPGGDVAESWIRVYAEPPSVRFVERTSRQARAAALRAIDNINAWLPWEKHVTVGTDLDAAMSAAARENAEFDIEPDHDRIKAALFSELSPSDVVAYLDAENLGEGVAGNAGGSQFNLLREHNTDVRVIQHELLHILGLNGGRACYEKFGGIATPTALMARSSTIPMCRFPGFRKARWPMPHRMTTRTGFRKSTVKCCRPSIPGRVCGEKALR